MSDLNKKLASLEAQVPSPCVSICALDDNDICVGCYRSGQEISRWGRLEVDERKEVLARCNERAKSF